MKIATWNVNSLKVRLPHLLGWLAEQQPDVVCLQETKQQDADFPHAELQAAGYHSVCSGQKSYNGVALLSREPIADVQTGIPDFADEQKRVIAGTIGDVRIVCVYVPNGQSVDSDKYQYKLNWLAALTAWLKDELAKHPKLALLGDYNIAPEDRDVITLGWISTIKRPDQEQEELVYVSGGMVEIQPSVITVLADTAIRGADLDEARALEARQAAEEAMQNRTSDIDYAAAQAELAEAIAQLRAIQQLRKHTH